PRDVIVTAGFFALPFAVLIWGMFLAGGRGYTPQYAACLAIIVAAALLLADAKGRVDWRRFGARLAGACLAAGRQVALIASIILCASIIVGVLSITGLGVKITSLILSASSGALWPALFLTALACLILGMEVPTTAAYVICVSIAGPALTGLGLEPLTAHLFVFWFALLSTITPPVCGAVFIAAGMVGENWLKVAVSAMALGLGLYLIPLAMIAHPDLLRLGAAPAAALFAAAQVLAGLAAISWGVIARGGALRRAALAGAGLFLLFRPALL
ncbi:MAG: TRAP transporter large permease subunit, partial [Paracoccaceae bacterium]